MLLRLALAALLLFLLCPAGLVLVHAGDEDGYEYIYEDGYEDEGGVYSGEQQHLQPKDLSISDPKPDTIEAAIEIPIMAKRGFTPKYYVPGSSDEEIFRGVSALVGDANYRMMNESMSLYDCWPKGDLRGSRADGTEEMQTIADFRRPKAQAAPKESRKKTVQEIQEEKMRKRLEEATKTQKMARIFNMGTDCETLICGTCKAIVEEFAVKVHDAVTDPAMEYIDQVFFDLCQSRTLGLKYQDIVTTFCSKQMNTEAGYKEALFSIFEQDTNFKNMKSVESVVSKKKKFCLGISACTETQMSFSSEPIYRYQEQWDEKCFVCQAMADDIEEKVLLHRKVTDGSAASIVSDTCNRLALPPGKFADLCSEFVKGAMGDDIAWITKVYADRAASKLQTEKRFSDTLCEEMKLCKKWLNDEQLSREKTIKEIDAVFE